MPAHFDLPRAVASLKEPRVPVSDYAVRICPGILGYWGAIYDPATATNPLHETDMFLSRAVTSLKEPRVPSPSYAEGEVLTEIVCEIRFGNDHGESFWEMILELMNDVTRIGTDRYEDLTLKDLVHRHAEHLLKSPRYQDRVVELDNAWKEPDET